LIDENSVSKIQNVAEHVGTTYAGPSGDYRVLLKEARKNSMNFYLSYGCNILMSNLTRTTAQTVQSYTQGGGIRPFGVSVLMAGVDNGRPQLFQIDPSGAFYEWKATAVGKNAANAKKFLEKRYNEDLE